MLLRGQLRGLGQYGRGRFGALFFKHDARGLPHEVQ